MLRRSQGAPIRAPVLESIRRFLLGLIGLCVIALLSSQPVAAHGTHIWFIQPKQDDVVDGLVSFEVEAPYAKNHYINLKITPEGASEPVWEGLVELVDKRYATKIDTHGWKSGKYQAEVILLGALVQHPVALHFSIR